MLVYDADKAKFLRDHDDRDIESVILDRYIAATGHRVAESEIRSWRNSLSYMARVLRDDGIPDDSGIGVELHLPQSSKRIDVTVTGLGPTGDKNAVVIELKQWEFARSTPKDAIVATFLGQAQREVVHPSYQAWSYATLLESFNEAVYQDGGIAVRPCAYLHNYLRDGVIDADHYAPYIERAPLFLKGEEERARLREFIKRYVRHGDAKVVLYELSNGRIRPSKALVDGLRGLLKGKPEFVLIDDQKEVFETALAAGKAASSKSPRTVIVEGGPGTGKTIVAINLLSRLLEAGLNCRYVSKNAAPRRVYVAQLTGTAGGNVYSNLFKGSGAFIEARPDEFDVLIVDEAHRLNEKSGLYGNLGDNQIKELISAAKCTIFLIDEDQRISVDDVGTKAAIEALAQEKGRQIQHCELESQFRCNGSDGYLAWLDHVLDIRPTANTTLDAVDYDFKVFDTPEAMHRAIEERNGNNRARVVAGYCWDWVTRGNPAGYDIEIGENYKRRWNLDEDGPLWIIAPESIAEVGCIHTCQGLELEYVGVIIGPDFLVRDDRIETVPTARARYDRTMRGLGKMRKADPARALEIADRIIKNTYRTLMTRGMKGCYIHCTDPETAEYFRDVSGQRGPFA